MEAIMKSAQTLPTPADAKTEIFESGSPLLLKEFVNVADLKGDVQFDVNDLDTAVMEHAGLFVFYADKSRLARRQSDRMKASFEITESRLYALHRTDLVAKSGKATEAQVQNAVTSDPRWWEANKLMIDARAIFDLASDAREAFMQRRDMIVQCSVDRRHERTGQVRVMEERSNRDTALAAGKAGRAGIDSPAISIAG